MRREEQISQANPYDNGNPYWDEDNDIIGARDFAAHRAFEEGALWADSHPNWHKYPDDKPSKNGEYLAVFTSKYPEFNGKIWIEKTMFLDGGFCSLIFDGERDSEIDCLYKEDVIAWMELPQPPKFD